MNWDKPFGEPNNLIGMNLGLTPERTVMLSIATNIVAYRKIHEIAYNKDYELAEAKVVQYILEEGIKICESNNEIAVLASHTIHLCDIEIADKGPIEWLTGFEGAYGQIDLSKTNQELTELLYPLAWERNKLDPDFKLIDE